MNVFSRYHFTAGVARWVVQVNARHVKSNITYLQNWLTQEMGPLQPFYLQEYAKPNGKQWTQWMGKTIVVKSDIKFIYSQFTRPGHPTCFSFTRRDFTNAVFKKILQKRTNKECTLTLQSSHTMYDLIDKTVGWPNFMSSHSGPSSSIAFRAM